MIAQLSLFNPEGLALRTRTGSSPTLRGFFQSDYDVAKLAGVKPKSRLKYLETLTHWQRATSNVAGGGELLVSELEPPAGDAHVLAFYRHLLAQPGRYGRARLSDTSIRRHLSYLTSILELAVKRGLLSRLPSFPVHRVDPLAKIPKRWITPDEFERLVASPGPCDRKRQMKNRNGRGKMPSPDWWRALLCVCWCTAARIEQAMALEWRDLSGEDEDVIELRPLYKRSRASQHKVLDQRTVELLAKVRRTANSPEPTARIFAGLGPHANLADHFVRLCKWAGIEMPKGSAWHSLRRGRCMQGYQQMGLAFAQDMLGHVDLATTEQSYLNEELRRAESIARQRLLLMRSAEETRRVSEGTDADGCTRPVVENRRRDAALAEGVLPHPPVAGHEARATPRTEV